MSGGAAAFQGLGYQLDYASYRILASEALRRLDESAEERIASIGIESRGTTRQIWDVRWRMDDGQVHLRECKDTEITAEHRKKFYRWIRKECTQVPEEIATIGWVTDPTKQGGFVEHWPNVPPIIADATSDTGREKPQTVRSARSALEEALYYLCHEPESEARAPGLSLQSAQDLLSRLHIDLLERVSLADAVELLAGNVFERGSGRALRNSIIGQIHTEIQSKGTADFPVDEFVEQVGTDSVTLGISRALRDILTYHQGEHAVHSISGLAWSHFQSPDRIWGLQERLSEFDHDQSCLIVGRSGAGKSTLSKLAARKELDRRDSRHVLHVEAGNVTRETVTALPHLCSLLCGVSPTWLAIDGLDLIERADRIHWKQTLQRLFRIPRLTLLLTAREEVLDGASWLSELYPQINRLSLEGLTSGQIDREFDRVGLPTPENESLRACLRVPFLFSLYARIARPDDMPLSTSGSVTGFDVVREYWNRRVWVDSEGHRVHGNPDEALSSKRRAVHYLNQETMRGQRRIEVGSLEPPLANGIEMLCAEGVLRRRGHCVEWDHTWLREYAAAEALIADHGDRISDLVGAVTRLRLETDHAARDAARGLAKRLASEAEPSGLRRFLTELYAAWPGLASDALAIILREFSSSLRLAEFPDRLLIEAIDVARVLRTSQWETQITSLPDQRFSEQDGPRLQKAVIHYELSVCGNGNPESRATRWIRCDRLIRQAGHTPSLFAIVKIIEWIRDNRLFQLEGVQAWLAEQAASDGGRILNAVAECLKPMIEQGASAEGCELLRRIFAFSDADEFRRRRQLLLGRNAIIRIPIEEAMEHEGIVSQHPDSWGATLLELESALFDDKRAQFSFGANDPLPENRTALHSCYASCARNHRDGVATVGRAVEQGFRESLRLSTPDVFQSLFEQALHYRSVIGAAQGLDALDDFLASHGAGDCWQKEVAVKLLPDDRLARLEVLSCWRRRIRRQLLASLSAEQTSRLLQTVRQAELRERIRLEELSDFRPHNVLDAEEIECIDEALAANKIFEPTDMRQLASGSQTRWPARERPDEEFARRWPYPEDREAVRLLREIRGHVAEDDQKGDALEGRLAALRRILGRPESLGPEWRGYVLGWCAQVLHDLYLRLRDQRNTNLNEELPGSDWAACLTEAAPWWEAVAGAALGTLAETDSTDNASDVQGAFVWSEGDPMVNACIFLNVLLVARTGLLEDFHRRLRVVLREKWPQWSDYGRATTLCHLNPCHWRDGLEELLLDALRRTLSSDVVKLAVERLLLARCADVAAVLPDVMRRADCMSRPHDVVGLVGEILGQSMMAVEGNGSDAVHLRALAAVFTEVEEALPQDESVRRIFIRSVVHGAECALPEQHRIHENHRRTWLRLARWAIDESVPTQPVYDESRQTVINLLDPYQQLPWTPQQRTELFRDLVDALTRVIACGGLGEFHDVHHDLSQFLQSGQLTEPDDEDLIELCRVSAERVAAWTREKRGASGDLNDVQCLTGELTGELIETVLDCGTNRELLDRELPPIVDLLSEVGLSDAANRLRVMLYPG